MRLQPSTRERWRAAVRPPLHKPVRLRPGAFSVMWRRSAVGLHVALALRLLQA